MKLFAFLLLSSLASVQAVPILDAIPQNGLVMAQEYIDHCLPNRSLSSYEKEKMFNNRCLCTENERYEFCVWGNELMLWDNHLRTRIWSANNPTDQEVYLVLTYDGTLTLRNRLNDKLVWASDDDYVDPFLSMMMYDGYNDEAMLYLLEEGSVDILKKDEILWSIPDNGRSTVERITCVGNTLRFGQNIGAGEYICSNEKADEGVLADNGFAFGLNSKGQVVLYYASNKKFFTISEKKPKEANLVMHGNGNLALYDNEEDTILFETNTSDNFGAYLTIENDGVVKIRSMDSCILWSELPNDGCKSGPLKPNDRLKRGQFLCYGNYRFGMDNDGDLSWWNWGSGEKLASVSSTMGSYAIMLRNGNLIVKNAEGKNLWMTRTWGNNGSVLFMKGPNRNNIQILNLKGAATWALSD
mmetsp:Transcript_29110/g.66713  ORF Transcript_29110/g.66713 Transcript_29110/m.66713 type:complete len:413 (-) Transcript_29110:149-1387(-)